MSRSFKSASLYTAGQFPKDVSVADVTGDGIPDLVFADTNARVLVLAGNGSGGFGPPTTYSVGNQPSFVTTADMNRDGKTDLVVADDFGYVEVLLGNGSGGFTLGSTYYANAQTASLAIADVNGDGKPDVIYDDGSPPINYDPSPTRRTGVLLGDGSGGFTAQIRVDDADANQVRGITTADFNRDGKADFAAIDKFGEIIEQLGNGSGGFETHLIGSGEQYAYGLTAGDVNGDGIPDLIVAGGRPTDDPDHGYGRYNPGSVSVLLGNGSGGFGGPTTYAAGANPHSVTLADVNGDGRLDMIVADYGSPLTGVQGGVSVLLGNGSGGFGTPTIYSAGSEPNFVTTADLNRDGLPDIVVTDRNGGEAVLLGTNIGHVSGITATPPRAGRIGTGQRVVFTVTVDGGVTVTGTPVLMLSNGFTAVFDAAASTATALAFNYTVANGQATTDLQATSLTLNGGTIGVGTLALGAATTFAAGPSPRAVATADVNRDGRPDLLVADAAGGVSLLLGNGSGGFAAATSFAAGPGPTSLTTADVNGDGVADLVVGDYNGGVAVLLGNASGGFAAATTFAVGSFPTSVATADLNRDGKVDIVAARQGGISVLLGNGAGGFTLGASYATGSNPAFVTMADVNADGITDVVFAATAGVSVLLGNGGGGFAGGATYAAGPNPDGVTVADVNGDGTLDLVVADKTGGVAVLLANGSGGFRTAVTYAAGPSPQGVTTTDINRDGKLDLVVADYSGGVSVLLGDGSGGFGTATTFAAGPNPVFVTTADLNRDGTVDLIVADRGGGVAVLSNTSLAAGVFDATSAATAPGRDTGLVIDGIAPTVTGGSIFDATTVASTGTAAAGDVLYIYLSFSEAVTLTGSPTLTLNDGATASYEPGLSSQTTLVFSTVVAAGQNAFALSVTRFVLPAGASLVDAAGNNASLLKAAVTFNGFAVNTAAVVTVTGITSAASAPNPLIVGQTVRFTLTTGQSVVVTGSPVLTLSDGGTAIFNAALSAGRTLVFDYTVASGESSSDLLVSALTLNGATVAVSAELGMAAPVTYAAGPGPAALVSTDLNGDGRPDLVVADSNGGVAVLLGNGSGFAAATTFAAGPTPAFVATGDLNGDGKADLVVADRTGGVAVLLGNGSGGFAAPATFAAGTSPQSVAVADVNADGRLDLVVADGAGVLLLLGDGGGGFAAATTFAAGPTPVSVAVADVNADGRADLVVADMGGGVAVLLGDGSGRFGAPTTYAAGPGPDFVTAADLNGDGRPDLVVADGSGGVSVLLGNGSGGFAAATTYAAGPSPRSVTVADVDGDGKLDLVVVGGAGGASVLLGNGAGGFGAPTSFAAGQQPVSVTTADANGDGKPDLVVAGAGGSVALLVNTSLPTTTFTPSGAATAPGRDTGIVIDAAPTITGATASPGSGSVTLGQTITITLTTSKGVTVSGTPMLTLNDGGIATYVAGSSTATSLVFTTTVTQGQTAFALAVNQVNLPAGSSIVDAAGNPALLGGAAVTFDGLAVITPVIVSAISATATRSGPLAAGQGVTFTLGTSRAVSVTGSPVLTLSNNSTATFDAAASGASSLVFRYTVAAGQDTADLRVSSLTLNGATVAVPGLAGLGSAVAYAAGPTPIGLASADLNGDGRPDVVVADSGTGGGVAVLFGNGSGGFAAPVTYAAGPTPFAVAIADVNGDGKADLAVADQAGGVSVLLGNGSGGFGAPTTFSAGPTPYSVVATDVSGDGKADLVVADYAGGVSVLLGNGSGGFATATTYAAGPNPYAVTTADINGDGKADLVVAARNGGVAVLLGNGSGGFATATTYAAGTRPRFVTVADLNGDGLPDLVVANMGPGGATGGGMSVLLANGSGGFGAATTYAAGPNPRTLVTTDLDGDGKLDVVVADQAGGLSVLLGLGNGSFGTVTSYATTGRNAAITLADVNGDARPDVVVTDLSSNVDVLLNNSAAPGTFVPASAGTAPGGDSGLVIDTTPPTVTQSNTHGTQLVGTAEAGGTVTVSNGMTVLGTAPVGTNGSWQFTPNLAPGSYTLTASEPDTAGNTGATTFSFVQDSPACFCRGTLILTSRGKRPVEELAIGDELVTKAGAVRPLRWIGRRSYAGRFLRRSPGVQPVRFRAGCLGDGLPRRDLLVSPNHAMFLDGVLVPAAALVNGTTIIAEREMPEVAYFHLELDTHDIILAEGAPTESFVDDDSRGLFSNAAEFAALYPDAPAPGGYCVPRVENGWALAAIRARLSAVARLRHAG